MRTVPLSRFVISLFLSLVLLGLRSPAGAQSSAPAGLDPKLCTVPVAPSEEAQKDRKAKRKARGKLETAHAAYVKGDFATAITALQAAYALEPGVDILYNIAQSCREAGFEREALPLYEEVLKQGPTPEQKEANQTKIAELKPKIAEAENARAVRALDDKRYDEAIAGMQRAIALNPQPGYLFRLGEAQRLAGRNGETMTTYERILKEAPASLNADDARRQLGALKAQQADERATAHYDKGEYVQAVLVWDSAYKEDARPIFLFRKAEAMRQTGQRKEAADEYERFLRESPASERPELRQQATTLAQELRLPPKGTPIREKKPIYKRWWFWTILAVGVVAVGAAGAGAALAKPRVDPPTVPTGVALYEPTF